MKQHHAVNLILRSLKRQRAPAETVFNFLVGKARRDGSTCLVQTDISDHVGYSLMTVKRCTYYLAKYGFIEIHKALNGRANIYVVNGYLMGLSEANSRFYKVIYFQDSRIKA